MKQRRWYLVMAGLLAVMAYQGLYGKRGWFALQAREQAYQDDVRALNRLIDKRNALQSNVSALQEDSLDLDVLEQQVKKNLGLYRDNERIIRTQEQAQERLQEPIAP
ncbi:MAG: septum formation initiator family protein [Alphaproteobacteria bacterium GM202ARS2]|nr:septum formation initiator family protein [Alphaproteobacteria bacterium GM202ARS2]